jgi:hypothetical protein
MTFSHSQYDNLAEKALVKIDLHSAVLDSVTPYLVAGQELGSGAKGQKSLTADPARWQKSCSKG